MRIQNCLTITVLCIAATTGYAQSSYPVAAISQELIEGANAVVQVDETEVTVKSAGEVVVACHEVRTALNAEGQSALDFRCGVSKYESLKSFSAVMYDAQGNVVKKYKKGDLAYSEYFSGLKSDLAHYWLTPAPARYPCTLEVNYELVKKDMVLSYPSFVTFGNRGRVSQVSGGYTLTLPAGMEVNVRNENTEILPLVTSSANGGRVYRWEVADLPAARPDQMMPDDSRPQVLIMPKVGYYEGQKVDLSSWGALGKWMDQLYNGRDILPQELRQTVHSLTDHLNNPYDKMRALYDYMCRNYRYVSIQVGIGGLQPMAVADVYRSKFGDCKALSFLMQAMLKEVGVPSYMTFIDSERRSQPDDFVTLVTTDHNILCIPPVTAEADTLWVECTSSTCPFGYIHRQLAGHDCYVIDGERTRRHTIPLTTADNIDSRQLHATLSSDGKAEIEVTLEGKGLEFESLHGFAQLTPEQQRKSLVNALSLNDLAINDVKVGETDAQPYTATVTAQGSSRSYGNKTGKRISVAANPLRGKYPTVRTDRKAPINVPNGFTNSDVITLTLPEGMTVESLPKAVDLTTPYGTFTSSAEAEGNTVTIRQRFQVNPGKYPAEEAAQFNELIQAVNKRYTAKLILLTH
ncbi:MAG: DUF3857 domain-containing protein [Bacteroidales bacterium]|nr:DUF3857 domain-containing protein [Bacteroidales bacterium]